MIEHNNLFYRTLRAQVRDREIFLERPQSDFPELAVTVPDAWETVQLAPIYDPHIGSLHHDDALFARHLDWIERTPNVLTWLGGDIFENASKLSVGAGVYEQELNPQNQLVRSGLQLARIAHKTLFSLPGNHEDRALVLGFDVGQVLAWPLDLPYFTDYVFCTLKWRGNNFRLLAHHGSGASSTAGAQRMAARKDIAWARPFDLYWTGHLHNPLVDVLYQTDVDQKTGRMFERNGLVVISPSYLRYYGSYAAKKRYPPGTRGLSVAILNDDGRIDASVHARGRRL